MSEKLTPYDFLFPHVVKATEPMDNETTLDEPVIGKSLAAFLHDTAAEHFGIKKEDK